MAGYNEDVNINLNILAGAMGGITAIMGGMSALTSTFGQFGTTAVDSFGEIEGLLVSASALAVAFGIEAANAAGEFEQGMKIVQAVSGQTSGAIQQLGEQANQLSVQYRTAIGDITEGLQTLGRAGLNSADSQLEVLESGLQTAKLEGRNLNGVLEELIQNTALLGGNLDSVDFGKQSEYINSLMVGTSMSAPIDTHDISQTLQYVGGTAAAAGANLEDKEKLEDLMGTIAAFAQKGVTGSMAGTALRAFLTKPASQDKSVTTGLSAIGLSPDDLWENGGESMKDVSDQIELIQRQMDKLNLSTMDQLEIWGKIVGPKMGQQMMKLDADKIKDLKSDIQDASSAEELAASTLSTYTQNVNEMGQIASGIFRQLGTNIIMWLNPVIQIINKILSLFNNKAGGIALFGGMLALISRGASAAYGMITSIVAQIKMAVNDIRTGIASISGSEEGAINGANRYDSIVKQAAIDIKMMNTNLKETNTLWGQFQAAALGKAANAQIRGYGPHNPMPQSLIGITDNYTQYFKKKMMEFEAYKFNGKIGINEGQYNALPSASQKKFEKIGDDVTYRPKNVILSPTDYYKLPPELQSMYKKERINQDQYNKLNPVEQKKYKSVEPVKLNKDAYYYISQDEYQKLSSAEKANYTGKNDRLETHVGTMDQMRAHQAEAIEKYRMVSSDYWKQASEEEQKQIVKATDKYKKEIGDYLKNNYEVLYKKDQHGNYLKDAQGARIPTGEVEYQVIKNKPLPEKLDVLERRQKKDWAEAIANARLNEKSKETTSNIRDGLSRGAKVRFDELQKLGQTANTASQNIQNSSNVVKTAANGVGGRFQSLRSNISTAYSQINSFGKGISLTAQSIGPLTNQFQSVALKVAQAESGLTAMSLQTMSVDTAFKAIQTEMGLSEKEFAELIIASESVRAAFIELTGATEQAVLAQATNTLEKNTSKLGGVFNSLVGQLGGSFSAALMGATIAVQALQAAFQHYQQSVQKAQTEMSEAKQKREEYENEIKDLYSSENDNLTEGDLDRALTAQYGTLNSSNLNDYGSATVPGNVKFELDSDEKITDRIGDENYYDEFTLSNQDHIKALNDNTVQLAAATVQYAKAANKASDTLNDSVYGMKGIATDISDKSNIIGALATITGPGNLYQLTTGADDKKSIFKTGSPNLTPAQKSDSYVGSTELAGIIAADAHRFGAEGGIAKAFGTDLGDVREKLGGIESNTYKSMIGLAQNAANMTPEQAAAAQVSLKEHKADYQRIGKLLAKREILGGQVKQTSPLLNANLGTGNLRIKGQKTPQLTDKKGQKKDNKTAEQQLKELRAIDKDLDNTIAKLIKDSNGKLTTSNIIAMSQLQQFQDMYDVAQSQIAPGVMNAVEMAYNNVIATQGAGNAAGEASAGAGSAAANAAIIAQFLAQQAIDKAAEKAHKNDDSLLGLLPQNMWEWVVRNDDIAKFAPNLTENQRADWAKTTYVAGDMLQHPGLKADQYESRANAAWEDVKNQMEKNGTGYKAGLATMSSGIKDYAEAATLAAYVNSDIGEGKSNKDSSGGGDGGGDGGSGSGDSGKNTKNRVDLVLCNKKEIPKLNVNLFKKEPNFTVLNKNFKLRDIKINTKDTPKSILDAVKNGIIDTAKRMDPKIIQDEESVYDPMGATEGTDVPSGSNPTSSD